MYNSVYISYQNCVDDKVHRNHDDNDSVYKPE